MSKRKNPKPQAPPKRPAARKWFLGLLGLCLAAMTAWALLGPGGHTVGAWMYSHGVRKADDVDDATAAEFARTFGIDETLSRRFQARLTDGGRAGKEEVERRLKAFGGYVQVHRSEFSNDPAQAIRNALEDPHLFGESGGR